MNLKKINYFILTKSIGISLNIVSFVAPKKASQIAYSLFSEPRKGRLKRKQLPFFLSEAMRETAQFNTSNFEVYRWKGSGKTILLVHGWESNTMRWEKILPFLQSTGYTILAIDAPAHGLSDGKEFTVPKYAQLLHEICKKYNPEIIIGHSIGGTACIYYQYKYKYPKIEKLIILGAPSDLRVLLENFYSLLSLNARVRTNFELLFEKKIEQPIALFSGQLFCEVIEINGLLVYDTDDKIVLLKEAEKYKRAWKNAEYIQTNGLGHSMQDSNLYEQIVAYIKK